MKMSHTPFDVYAVSDDREEIVDIISIKSVKFEDDDGIIIATGSEQYALEMYELACQQLKQEHIFCRAII